MLIALHKMDSFKIKFHNEKSLSHLIAKKTLVLITHNMN